MSDSLLAAEVGISGSPAWDYRATFALPTVIEKAKRSLRKSLTGLYWVNPLDQHPVMPQATEARTLSSESFTSVFHRRTAASTHRNTFRPLFLQGQSGSVTDLQSPAPLPPLDTAIPPPQPSTTSGRSTELAQSDTDDSPQPLAMPLQVPPQAFQLPWHHRNSQMTMASVESEAHSFKSVPGWVKFHYSDERRVGGVSYESGKALPLSPLPTPPSSWLKAKVLRRSHSTTTSEGEERRQMASDNGDESAGAEQVAFGRSSGSRPRWAEDRRRQC